MQMLPTGLEAFLPSQGRTGSPSVGGNPRFWRRVGWCGFTPSTFRTAPPPVSSRDLVWTPRPERSPSQALLTHRAGRLSGRLPAAGTIRATGSLRSAPAPSMALSLPPPPRVFPFGRFTPQASTSSPHPTGRETPPKFPVGPETR